MATTYINPFVFAGEELGGMVLLTPTSIAYSGTSATVGANGSVEFSACTSLSLNGVFSADYDNYMIVFAGDSSATTDGAIRWRASGTDNSTASSYVRQYLYADGSLLGAARDTLDYARIIGLKASTEVGISIFVYGPHLAQPTAYRTVQQTAFTSGVGILDIAGTHNQSTSYDGFTVYPLSGNVSGLVSVYGLVGA